MKKQNYICEDQDGNIFLSFDHIAEDKISLMPELTHFLAVVKIGNEYLLGWNKWRNRYEIFGGCKEQGETLGEITVDEKTNEITAVPELLDLLYIENAIITADSMSCQKKIVQKISDKNADHCIALKENQPSLYKDTEDYFCRIFKRK